VRVRVADRVSKIETDRVVCATPLKELSSLIPVLTDEEKRVTADFVYGRFPMAVFFLKRRLKANHWAYVFSRTERFRASYASDARFKCHQMIPSGRSVIQVWFAGEAGDELVDEQDEKIVEQARDEMRRVLPDFDADVDSFEVVRQHAGMPRYRAGIYRRLRRFLASVSRFDGLHLVGDYYGHSTVETVVRSARRVAERLAASPQVEGRGHR
jgi:protoporphyrinogen oxidase